MLCYDMLNVNSEIKSKRLVCAKHGNLFGNFHGPCRLSL